MDNKILIIDIETTGFLQKGGKIVEIGIVELDLTDGKTQILFDEVCHETGITKKEVEDAWIIENSDMTVEEIRQSINLKKMQPEIQEIIDKYPTGATAFNNVFDFGFMKDRKFTFPKELPCPMKLSTNICKLPNSRGGYKWPKVQEAYDFFFGKNDYVEKHRGADDAMHEAQIVYELYKRKIFKLD